MSNAPHSEPPENTTNRLRLGQLKLGKRYTVLTEEEVSMGPSNQPFSLVKFPTGVQFELVGIDPSGTIFRIKLDNGVEIVISSTNMGNEDGALGLREEA